MKNGPMKSSLPVTILLLLVLTDLAARPGPAPGPDPAEKVAKKLSQEDVQKITGLIREAYTLYQGKKHQESNQHFREVLALMPLPEGPLQDIRFANIHYNMALNHYFLGGKQEALDSLSKAIDHGFWNHDFLSRDMTMKDLHGEKTYQDLLEKCRRGVPEMAFGLKDLAGNELKKEDYAGKVLVIDIWGTWCGPCKEEIPHFIKLQEKYGKDGLRVIGLTWERRQPDEAVKSRVDTFVKSAKINYPICLLTEGLLRAIVPPVEAFPTTLFIDRNGLITHRQRGLVGYSELEARILPLLSAGPAAGDGKEKAKEKPPASAGETPPVNQG